MGCSFFSQKEHICGIVFRCALITSGIRLKLALQALVYCKCRIYRSGNGGMAMSTKANCCCRACWCCLVMEIPYDAVYNENLGVSAYTEGTNHDLVRLDWFDFNILQYKSIKAVNNYQGDNWWESGSFIVNLRDYLSNLEGGFNRGRWSCVLLIHIFSETDICGGGADYFPMCP